MLKVSNLSLSYGDFLAVDSVSFTIAQGEIVGLLGHNGAGKTTVMKTLSGYLEPDRGEVMVNQASLANDPQKIQSQLGYLPENLPIYPEMTVAEYIEYAAELKGLTNKFSAIKTALTATDIVDKAMSRIATLSRGYKQRVGVAQAILGEPKLLILDEPTNGLDPTQTDHMRDLIKSIAKKATVILSTHIMQEVDALCDRVLIIRNGQLAIDSKLADLRKSDLLNLKTDLLEDKLNAALQQCTEIAITPDKNNATANGSQFDYQINLVDHLPQEQQFALQSKIASAIINNGGQLFQLNPITRDLEFVFREVNRGVNINKEKGVSHAA